jgi:hypothetical protein
MKHKESPQPHQHRPILMAHTSQNVDEDSFHSITDESISNRRQPLKNNSKQAIIKARFNIKHGSFVRPSVSEIVDLNQNWRNIDLV